MKRASVQQKKLIGLLMDLTQTSYEQLCREMNCPRRWVERPTRKRAGSMIAYLVRVAEKQGVPTYKYRSAPVKKYNVSDLWKEKDDGV